MESILVDYYFTLLEVLFIVFLVGAVGAAAYWGRGRRWQNRLTTLEQEHADELKTLQQRHTDDRRALEQKHTDELKALEEKHADDLARHDSKHFQALSNHLQSAVAHEFVRGVDYIAKKSAETLEGLTETQNALRDKQDRIVIKAHELTQHAENILDVFAEWQDLQNELLSVRQLVEHVVVGFSDYAESKRVTVRLNLADVEPTVLDRHLTLEALGNVIHNAIKYSFPGGVVEITLSLEEAERPNPGKVIWVDVKDTGKGIREEDQDKIFELRVRGDGLIETGSGLGLYLARQAARRQGGDVILVRSSLNQGSVFRIILPYTAMADSDA